MKKYYKKISALLLAFMILLGNVPLGRNVGFGVDAIAVDNTEVSNLYSSSNNIGRDVVLVIDISGSMDDTKGESAKKVAKAICNEVLPNKNVQESRIGVVAFNDEATTYGFYSEQQDVLDLIDSLVPTGNTNIGKGLSAADELLSGNFVSEKLVVFISDGNDLLATSSSKLNEIIALLQEKANIISVGIGSNQKANKLEKIGVNGYFDYEAEGISSELLLAIRGKEGFAAFSPDEQRVIDALAFDIDNIISDINLTGGKLKFPTLSIKGKDRNLGELEASVNLPLGANATYTVDLNEKRIKIMIGVTQDENAEIGPDGQTSTYWSESYRDVKTLYQNVTGKKVTTTKLWNQFSSIRGKVKKMDCSLGLAVSAKIVGYIELDYSTNAIVFQEGGIVVGVESKAILESNISVSPGIFVSMSLEPSVGGSIKAVAENGVISYEGNVLGELSAEIGIGIGDPNIIKTYIKGGLTGTIGMSYTFPADDLASGFSAYLKGKAFAESKVLGFTVYKDSWDLGKYQLYPTEDAAGMAVDVSEFANNAESLLSSAVVSDGTYNTDLQSSKDEFILNNIYYDSAPELIQLGDDNMMLVWTGDDGTKTDTNRTNIFYSVFDGTAWSTTEKISNNDCYNSSPVAIAFDGKVYVFWQRTNSPVASDAQLTDVLTDIDLYYSVYENGVFSTEILLTSNENYAELSHSAIASSNGINVIWVENSENNIYATSGVNTLKKVTLLEDSTVTEPEIIAQSSIPFGDYVAFESNGFNVAYTTCSPEYDEVFLFSENETSKLTESSLGIVDIHFDGDKLAYSEGGKISLLDLTSCESVLLTEGLAFDCSFYSDKNTDAIISTYKYGNEYYVDVVEYDSLDSTVKSSENIFRSERYIYDYDVIINGDFGYVMAMNSCDFDVETEEIFDNYSLSVNFGELYNEISVNDVAWCYDNIAELAVGSIAEIGFEVTNVGNTHITNLDYTMVDVLTNTVLGEGTLITDLGVRGTQSYTVNYIVPNNKKTTEIKIQLSVSGVESNISDNYAQVKLGGADVVVQDFKSKYGENDTVSITATIKNMGLESAKNISFTVYETGQPNTIIIEQNIGELAYNEQEIVEITLPTEYWSVSSVGQLRSLEIVAVCDTLEKDIENNSQVYVYEHLYPFEYTIQDDGVYINKSNGTYDVLEIPEKIDGVDVVGICSGAFSGDCCLKTVSIPKTVTMMAGAFYGCINLEMISISEYNTVYKSSDGIVYNKDGSILEFCPISNPLPDVFVIPAGTTTIGDSAFSNNRTISIIDASNVTDICTGAFANSEIKECILSEELSCISSGAFAGAKNLIKIDTKNVSTIEDGAFMDSGLKECILGPGFHDAGYSVFENCTNLVKLKFDAENYYFNSIYAGIEMFHLFYKCENIEEIIIGGNVKEIPSNLFEEFYCLEKLTFELPSQLSVLSSGLFSDCGNLKEVLIPRTVKEICGSVFRGCYNLETVSFEKESLLELIGSYAFADTKIKNIEIPSSVKELKSYAFSDCRDLKSVDFETMSSLEKIGEFAFNGSQLTSVLIPASVNDISSKSFSGCDQLEQYTVDEKNVVYSSIDGILYDADVAKVIDCPINNKCEIYEMPKTLVTIGAEAFKDCKNIVGVISNDKLEIVEANAFSSCIKLEKLELPDTVSSIDSTFIDMSEKCITHCFYGTTPHNVLKDIARKYELRDFILKNNSFINWETKCIYTEGVDLSDLSSQVVLHEKSKIELFMLPSFKNGDKQYLGTGSKVFVYFNNSPQESFDLVVMGDVNGDSSCDVLDCLILQRTSAQRMVLDGLSSASADLNYDGVIDVLDYQCIINRAVSL